MEINIEERISGLKIHDNIREIYLFGSVARGEQDENSDVDILIVIDGCTEEEYIKYKKKYAEILNIPVSWISLYRVEKINKMYQIGSYFLWHIKKEGKKLYSRNKDLEIQLNTLPFYKNTDQDLAEYTIILNDIKAAIQKEVVCYEYELAVLASLVRNTCIAISYMDGKMDFGRETVVEYCINKYNLNVSIEEYRALYKYRLYNSGKLSYVASASLDFVIKWIEVEENLLEIAKRR